MCSLVASLAFADSNAFEVTQTFVVTHSDYNVAKVSVELNSDLNEDLNNVAIAIYIPELAWYFKKGHYNVGSGDQLSMRLYMPLPDAEGEYLARIVISSGNGDRRVKHRYITLS